MIKRSILPATFVIISILACGNNGGTKNSANEAANTAPKLQTTMHESPCEFIAVDDVRKLFAIPEKLDIKMEDRILTYPTCSFEWEDGKVVSVMEVGSREIEIRKPSEVMIVMVKDARPSMYETASRIYKDIEPVENVGEMASWGNQMSQLTFLAKNHLFHVHVKASNDDVGNRAKAIEIARSILSQL
jgi:hypothetical protein